MSRQKFAILLRHVENRSNHLRACNSYRTLSKGIYDRISLGTPCLPTDCTPKFFCPEEDSSSHIRACIIYRLQTNWLYDRTALRTPCLPSDCTPKFFCPEEGSSANLRACVSYKVLPESALTSHCGQAPSKHSKSLILSLRLFLTQTVFYTLSLNNHLF